MFKSANFIGLIKAAQDETPSHYPGIGNVSVEPYTAPAPASYGHRMSMDEWKDAERARLGGLGYNTNQIETMLTNKAYRKSNGGRNYVSTKGFKVRNKQQPAAQPSAQPATPPNVGYTANQVMPDVMRDSGAAEYAQRMGYAQPQENVTAKQQPAGQPAAGPVTPPNVAARQPKGPGFFDAQNGALTRLWRDTADLAEYSKDPSSAPLDWLTAEVGPDSSDDARTAAWKQNVMDWRLKHYGTEHTHENSIPLAELGTPANAAAKQPTADL